MLGAGSIEFFSTLSVRVLEKSGERWQRAKVAGKRERDKSGRGSGVQSRRSHRHPRPRRRRHHRRRGERWRTREIAERTGCEREGDEKFEIKR